MSLMGEKSGLSTVRTSSSPKSHMNKLIAAALLTSVALYCCRTRVFNAIEDVLFLPFAPQPEDYCKQVDAFDASNWTAAYDADGFEAKAAEWLGGAVRIPYVFPCEDSNSLCSPVWTGLNRLTRWGRLGMMTIGLCLINCTNILKSSFRVCEYIPKHHTFIFAKICF
jgi:hypothetical protein